MPSFECRYNHDAYLTWELEVKKNAYHDFSEDKMVKTVVGEFTGFASI